MSMSILTFKSVDHITGHVDYPGGAVVTVRIGQCDELAAWAIIHEDTAVHGVYYASDGHTIESVADAAHRVLARLVIGKRTVDKSDAT